MPLDGDGNVIGGALEGQNFSEAKSEESSKEGTAKGSEPSKTLTRNESNSGSEAVNSVESQNESEGGETEKNYAPPKRPADVNRSAHTNEYIGNYFKSHPGEEPKIREAARQYSNRLDAVKHFDAYFDDRGDATYDMKTRKPITFDNGYSVTFQQNHSATDPFADYTNENYSIMCAIAMRELGSEDVYIGKYNDCPEVSFHCMDKTKAIEFAQIHNQESIYDNENDDLILNMETYDSKTNPTRIIKNGGDE